jgi:MoxR-like ATPase
MSEQTIVLNPTQYVSFIVEAIKDRAPVLVTGAPGIGKTDLNVQATAIAGADLIVSHPAVEDPTDVKGLPWVVDGAARFLPLGQVARVLNATRPTVWFLDDLGQATPAMQAAYMQWLLARECNGHRLPDHVTILAATNRRTDKAGVSGVLEPVKSRFVSIVELQPDLNAWCTWALAHGIPAEVIAFLRFKPDLLSAFVPTADLTNSPSPRTWAHVGRLLRMSLTPDVLHAVLAGAIGAATATELIAFLRLYATLPSVDAILTNPAAGVIPSAPNTLYALCGALAYRATPANFDRVRQYAERLLAERRGEFATLLVRDAITRHPELTQTQAYIRLQCTELGQIASGART